MHEQYLVNERFCNCTGQKENLILRNMTKEEYEKAKLENGEVVQNPQSIMVCLKCKGIVLEWLMFRKDVHGAKQLLSNRYTFTPLIGYDREELCNEKI